MTAWYDKAIFYHMYPLGMTGAPFANPYPVSDGTADGTNRDVSADSRMDELMQWIPYLESLHISAIYIGPLFESSTHGYDTRDFRLIDRRLGTNVSFRSFVDCCHEHGIRIVVDGVFNHTGREFFAFRDLQAHRDQSPYAGWYRNVNFGWGSPLGDSFGYESWHGIWELPCLNHGNPEVRNYLLDTVRFWVQEFDIDGIRLDCAGDLSFEFMQELRRLANEIKPEFWLMGEVIHGEYARWVNPQMLHSVTNYEMHKSIYSAHNDHNYFELAHNVRRLEAVGRDLYTFVDNHDEDRIASKLLNPAHLAPLYTLLFTLPGIPSIYYGSEWGIQGRRGHNSDTELRPRILPPRPLAEEMQTSDGQNTGVSTDGSCQGFSNATGTNIHAGANTCCQTTSSTTDSSTDTSAGTVTPLTLLIQKLAAIHAAEPALHGGRYQELLLTNRQYAFARHGDHQAILTAANNDDNAAYLQVPLPFHTAVEQAMDLITGKSFLIDKNTNKIQIELEGNSAVILGITEG